MVLFAQPAREFLTRHLERLHAAARELRQRFRSAHDVQRCALLRACLGQRQRACGEFERRQHVLRDALAGLDPVQSARDHQVDDHVDVVVERERDAFSDASNAADAHLGNALKRRLDGAQ